MLTKLSEVFGLTLLYLWLRYTATVSLPFFVCGWLIFRTGFAHTPSWDWNGFPNYDILPQSSHGLISMLLGQCQHQGVVLSLVLWVLLFKEAPGRATTYFLVALITDPFDQHYLLSPTLGEKMSQFLFFQGLMAFLVCDHFASLDTLHVSEALHLLFLVKYLLACPFPALLQLYRLHRQSFRGFGFGSGFGPLASSSKFGDVLLHKPWFWLHANHNPGEEPTYLFLPKTMRHESRLIRGTEHLFQEALVVEESAVETLGVSETLPIPGLEQLVYGYLRMWTLSPRCFLVWVPMPCLCPGASDWTGPIVEARVATKIGGDSPERVLLLKRPSVDVPANCCEGSARQLVEMYERLVKDHEDLWNLL